jgi:pimeloyl-ACP methyl ester carboxylesterase
MVHGFRDGCARARGVDFHWLEWGAAPSPPLVLLHGLTGHAHTWDHMAPDLAKHYHVFAPDQRGHGDSSATDSYATHDFVDDLSALLDIWGIDRFRLVGLSMGGHNAMSFAASHPERVERLVVIDIPPNVRRTQAPNWDVLEKLAVTGHTPFETFDDAYAQARQANPIAPEENLRYRTALNLIEQADGQLLLKYDAKAPARWEPEDLWPRIASLTMPTLIVRGGLTRVLAREQAERMAREFPNATLVEIGDSGHSVPTDRPEKLTPIVLDWLTRG